MANTRVLLRRRKAVRNTRKITKTMEKIATAKLAKAQHAAVAARPYINKLKEVIGQVAAASGEIRHPLLEEHENPRKAMVIVLTSDRGLCGSFNANIIRAAKRLIDDLKTEGRELEFIVQGKKGIGAFKFLDLPITERLVGVSDKPTFARAEGIADKLIAAYGNRTLDEAYVVYSPFRGGAAPPKQEMLLPLSALSGEGGAPAAKGGGAGYLFHPGPETILGQVLPQVVKMALFSAMLDNAAAEHAARRVAMKNATDSADDMIQALNQQYNRARQAKITNEIAEIVSGTNAL